MRILSIPCVVMASINFAVGIYYLYFHLRRPQIKEHLPFALLCLGVGLYDVFSIGLYNSASLEQGIFWQKLQLGCIALISVLLIWFSGIFVQQPGNKIVRFFMGWFLFLWLVPFFISPELTLSTAHPAIKQIAIGSLTGITYYEGRVGLFYQLEIISAIVAYVYMMFLFMRFFQSTRDKGLLLILFSLLSYFFGVLNDSLVATGVYQFFYLSEYSFSIIILSMAYILLNKFVDLHTAHEQLNINLEHKVIERTQEIEQLNRELKTLADHDGLTGVYNRRFFNEYFEIEVKRARNWLDHKDQLRESPENDMNFGIALIDIDHFKTINDHYGHAIGDAVLKQVVEIMKAGIFTRDVLCRYGGDEFVLLLTKTSNQGIYQAVEKIRKGIDEYEFPLDDEEKHCLHVTISIGLVNLDEVLVTGVNETLKLADDRLLQAKSQGRNRIVYEGS
jgi:diguanylate cyclase (GGDEF)-like protein